MRVCLVSAEYPPMQGGVGDCTHELGRALILLGYQVAVVTSTKANGIEPSSHRQTDGEIFGKQPSPDRRRDLRQAARQQPHQTDGGTDAAGSQSQEPAVYPIVQKWSWGSWKDILEVVQATQSDILHIQYQAAAYAMHPAINILPLRLRLARRLPPRVALAGLRLPAAASPRQRDAGIFDNDILRRLRVVVTFHDLRVPYLFPKAGVVRQWVTLSLARWSDAVIATNIEDYERLRAHRVIRSAAKNLHLIPIGSNIHPQPPAGYDRAAWRHSLGIGQNELVLSYFGFLNESKGAETLFRTLAELTRRGQEAKLLMIGGQVGDSDPTNVGYAEHIKALGVELGLQDRVLWTGYTLAEQVSAHFLASDICVLPYRDGASYRRGSFMAALAHGLPIVSTHPTAPIDSLVDGANILLVPADDPLATTEAVETLASTPALSARLKQGALQLARAFTWDAIASKTAQVYGEILSQAKG